jgi:ssDNA-binding replication factor A large subunit
MNTAPQQVTERYVSNLINYGRNREFEIVEINQQAAIAHDEVVGFYYEARTNTANGEVKGVAGRGATISQAVRRALEKHGVTFR